MTSCSKVFFSELRAQQLCDTVDGKLWIDRDAFGQTIYIVKWFE